MRNPFFISIHDVSPRDFSAICRIFDSLEPLVGNKISVAVIPKPWSNSDMEFNTNAIQRILDSSGEILLHGYTHRRQPSFHPFSILVNHSDELRGMALDAAIDALQKGQSLLEAYFGKKASGLVAPAWCTGPINAAYLNHLELKYIVGYLSMQSQNSQQTLLATWSWDCGIISQLGYGGEIFGRLAGLNPRAIPQVVFHPLDVPRGFLKYGLKRIKQLLDKGLTPALYQDQF